MADASIRRFCYSNTMGVAVFPTAGLVAITWIIAAYAIVFGVLRIVLGIRMRSGSRRGYATA